MFISRIVLRAFAILLCSGVLGIATGAEVQPSARITNVRIDKKNVVVNVEASGPLAKVTLESSTRVGRRAWEPRAVEVLKGTNTGTVQLTFTLPISPAIEILRVRGDLGDQVLPASFYAGTNKFVAATTGGGATAGPVPGAVDSRAPNQEGAGGDTQRTVTESDIWKVDGDTLYFFNQNRGLQVIDVASPDVPVLTGTYDLAAAGEQMYVVDHDKVVLLARDNCGWYGDSGGSRVILLQVNNGVPQLVKELPVAGYIAESRMVGTALYVVANSYEQRVVPLKDGTATSTEWEWGSRVLSFDLSNFGAAQEKSRDWVKGYGNVIYATDRYLFVAQTIYDSTFNHGNAVFNSYDISAPDGTFAKLSTFTAVGTVQDKFKMQVSGDTFSVVLQRDWQTPRYTYLKTFSFADPRNPQPLGELRIVENERLFATRFAGDRLYVVTFFLIDPLWIIDLKDPAAPKKVGELEIPGWSTYLQPLGDKLLAIGLDRTNGTQRTAVQLFDVADPTKPSLLSKVLIGEQWSGSEANWDEKAFGVLPEDKLVLVPFYSSGNEGYTQGVQLIDLESDALVKRGVVTQNMGARRATLHRGRILSLSSGELLTVDATDRDRPKVIKTTELSWSADRVHLTGNFVIEVDAYRSDSPALRVVKAENPATLLQTLSLTNLPYMGSSAVGDKLYVLQGKPIEVIYPKVYNPTNYFPIATNPAVFVLSEFDLGALPELRLARQATREGSTNYFYGQYEAMQVKPGVLVWRSKSNGYFPWWGPFLDVARGGGIVALAPGRSSSLVADRMSPIWWGGGGAGHFIAVDIGEVAFRSEVTLSGTNGWWNFGDAFTANGILYTSHQASEYDTTIDPPPYETQCYDNATGKWFTCTNDPPPGSWVQRYYMDVIDFNDPADPLARKPVNIPGSLIGLARGAELLYTRGYDQTSFMFYNGAETIAASSFDGVEAHLVSSLVLSNDWPRPSLANAGYIYLGAPPSKEETNATLQVWTLNSDAKFERVNSQVLASPAQQLKLVRDILTVQSNDILLFDARNAAQPVLVGEGHSNMCYGVLFDAADGDVTRGLWVPVGWYGVLQIPVKGAQ